MYKKCLLVFAFLIIFSFSSYAETESRGNLFFSIGFYDGYFDNRSLHLQPGFRLNSLSVLKIAAAWELPYGPGNAVFGAEAGYSSGSRFGGGGGVDFVPFALTAAYVIPLGNILYVGPSIKLGGLAR